MESPGHLGNFPWKWPCNLGSWGVDQRFAWDFGGLLRYDWALGLAFRPCSSKAIWAGHAGTWRPGL